VAVAAIAFAVVYPGAQASAWLTFARAMDQATSWVLCAVFGFIALFSSYFGIPWRHCVFGIGVGFLFYLSVDVAVTTIVAHFPLAFRAIWWLDMVAFMVACVIWGFYFAAREVARPVPTLQDMQRIRAVLRRMGPAVEQLDQR
jgi:hypothetical protein